MSYISRRAALADPALSIVRPGDIVRADGKIRPHDIGTVISAGANIIGGMMSSDAAGDATNAQAASSREAIEEQRRQYDLARADAAPFRDTGVAANQRLAYLLGLDVGGPGSSSAMETEAQIRARLAPQYTTKATDYWDLNLRGDGDSGGDPVDQRLAQLFPERVAPRWYQRRLMGAQGATGDTVDEAALNAAVQAELARINAGRQPQERGADYGSLTRRFSASDLASDPVYNSGLEFGLNEGRNAINARAMAGGGYDSGATLKALTRFGNDYGSTKAEGAYNRYNTDNTNVYNRLAGVSGAGQTATNTVTTAGMNAANNISNLQTGIGNARAAGIVGGANAWGGAMSGVNAAYNNYQNRGIVDRLLNRSSWGGGGNMSFSIDPYDDY